MSVAVATGPFEDEQRVVESIRVGRSRILAELSKTIVGQQDAIEQMLISLFAGGHCLITGAPGLAKTLLVKSIAQIFHLDFQRIQFTPDLMPADITGTEILEEDEHGRRRMTFVRGPIFANVVLADEINRTPPKTQAALLEAMQEHQVTAAGVRHVLAEPFFVLATQNPIEMEGTYPLPEAQLDRFMFNVVVDYLPENDEVAVVTSTTSSKPRAIQPLFTGEDVLQFHDIVRRVPIAEDVVRYAVRLSAASRPHQDGVPEFVNDWVSWGAGTRAAQYLVLGAKARALLLGRSHVTPDDIRHLAAPTLRHRILLNYRAEAAGITVEDLIRRLLETVKGPDALMSTLREGAGVAPSAPVGGRGPAAQYIDPATLMQIKSLELRARHVVEGFWAGLNRSPHHGFSVEFTEYRQYVQGDDTRYLDWRLLARSDRLYIKRFEDETNLRCNLLLDTSRSMGFGSLSYAKAEYARTLTATLAYFLTMQRDAVGLTTFDEKIDEYIPARYRAGHMRRLMTTLEKQVNGPATDLATPLSQIAERIAKRGMFILISDLMAPVDRLEASLSFLAARGNDILLFHVLDPAEVTLNFHDPALFEDVESGRQIYVDPSAARAEYRRRFDAHVRGIVETCERLGASYHQFVTDSPLEHALSEVLRMRLQGRVRRAPQTRSRPSRRPA